VFHGDKRFDVKAKEKPERMFSWVIRFFFLEGSLGQLENSQKGIVGGFFNSTN
jgi:hypothetical protein